MRVLEAPRARVSFPDQVSTVGAPAAKPPQDTQRLTAQQKNFADLWVQAKTDNLPLTHAEIAKAAGYTGQTDNALYVQACRTLRSPAVRAYLQARAKDVLADGQLGAAATLARLSSQAVSERVQADTAYRLAVGTGLLAPEGQAGSGSVVLQLVFRHSLDSVLSTPAQVIDAERDAPAAIPLAQGMGDGQSDRRAPRPLPRGGKRAAPKAKAGGAKTASTRPRSTPPHDSPVKTRGVGRKGAKASADFSGGRKSRVDGDAGDE